MEKKGLGIQQNKNQHNLVLNYKLKNIYFGNRDWETIIKFLVGGSINEKKNCFETKQLVFGGSSNTCNANGKKFISNKNDVFSPAITIDSSVLGIGYGLKNTVLNWRLKDTFNLQYNFIFKNYNYKFNENFINIDQSLIFEGTQEKPWIENIINLSFIRSYILSDKWSLAGGVDFFYLDRINYIRNFDEKEKKIKSKNTSKLNKKIREHFLILGVHWYNKSFNWYG